MKEKMTFTDLVSKIAEETGHSKQFVSDFLHETVKITKEGLENDGYVTIAGLGKFYLKWREARTGRNPGTGESIEIPAHNTVNYKAYADLRKHINRNYAELHAETINDSKDQEEVKQEEKDSVKVESPPVEEETKAVEEEKVKKKSSAWKWILIVAVIIVLAFIVWVLWIKPEDEPVATEPEKTEQEELIQPIEEEPVVAPEPIKETQPEYTIPEGKHRVKAGDNLWEISQSHYNNTTLWTCIFSKNHTEIKNPDYLAIGKILKLPPLEGNTGLLTHNDSATIAEGNLQVYFAYKKLNKDYAKDYLWVANLYDVDNILTEFKDKIGDEDMGLIKK